MLKFEAFTKKAYDIDNRLRADDTELKYIFNLVENHWDKGNRFVIEMESVLYSCTSCQRYMLALQEYAAANRKEIKFTFAADKRAKRMQKVEEFIQ